MCISADRRERLDQLLDLAQAYRGWNRKQLARALQRDASNLSPASGLPKLDLVIELAGVLDWQVGDIVHSIWDDDADPTLACPADVPQDFDALQSASQLASRTGQFDDAVRLARQACRAASSGEERAIASTREASGWDGLGRYAEALTANRRGLAERDVSIDRRRLLQVGLANEYYSLWQPLEARAIAHDLIQLFERETPRKRINRVSHAFGYYVRGNSHRRLMAIETERSNEHAQLARTDLKVADHLFTHLADDFGDESFRGIANTCQGGAIEAEVVSGQRDAEAALAELSAGLDTIVSLDDCPCSDWLESYGWWCIFGCNVAIRHFAAQKDMQHRLAVFTNKADEIAERTDNWAVRERLVTLEYVRRRQLQDRTGVEIDWTIDSEDVRAIAGTMGRFPSFHEIGWEILRSARIVKD